MVKALDVVAHAASLGAAVSHEQRLTKLADEVSQLWGIARSTLPVQAPGDAMWMLDIPVFDRESDSAAAGTTVWHFDEASMRYALYRAIRDTGPGLIPVDWAPLELQGMVVFPLRGLRGPVGPQGPEGAAGPQGDRGDQGVIGPAGPQGPEGPTGPAGPQGPSGTSGPQGPTGSMGLTGPAGRVGDRGPEGAVGPTGPSGPVGPQGAVGPKGVAGPQGEVGPTGPQGLVGPAGPAGPTGLQGITGATGAAGPQGSQGPQGDQGIQGLTGPAGPSVMPMMTPGAVASIALLFNYASVEIAAGGTVAASTSVLYHSPANTGANAGTAQGIRVPSGQVWRNLSLAPCPTGAIGMFQRVS